MACSICGAFQVPIVTVSMRLSQIRTTGSVYRDMGGTVTDGKRMINAKSVTYAPVHCA